LTIAIYLAHLNPVTNAHVEIIEELKKENYPKKIKDVNAELILIPV